MKTGNRQTKQVKLLNDIQAIWLADINRQIKYYGIFFINIGYLII